MSVRRSAPAHTVTGIFRHYADSVLTLTTSSGDEIGVTSNHPVWSADRQSFVRAGDLRPGETLRHLSGTTTLQTLTRRPAGALVYNLEIETSHVYHVSKSGILVHNTGDGEVCDLAKKAAEKASESRKNLDEAAKRLGVDPEDLASGKINIDISWKLDPADIDLLKAAAKSQGLSSVEVLSGAVVNDKLSAFLSRLSEVGRPFHGGKVELIEEVDGWKYFRIVFDTLK